MREKYFNSLANSREGKILGKKIRDYKKTPKKFMKILRIDRKLRKKKCNF
jgi:hypothetical protein